MERDHTGSARRAAGFKPRSVALAKRRPRRRSYNAIVATADEITFPKHEPIGYLAKTRLIQRAQQDDAEAIRIVWEGNARLAYSAANRMRVPPQLLADLIQASQLALYRAIKRFDTERLLEFSTYAYAAVWREMQRQVCSLGFLLRLPPSLYPKYIAYRAELEPPLKPCEWFDLREQLIERGDYDALRSIHAIIAWEPLTSDLPLASPGRGAIEPMLAAEMLDALRAGLDCLEPRERMVLERRFGLHGLREHTLEEVGLTIGLTRERIRQIQQIAEANLRDILVARGWDGPPPVPVASQTLAGR